MAASDKYPTVRWGEPQPGHLVGPPVHLLTTEGLPQEVAVLAGPWFEQLNTQAIDRRKTEEQRFAELGVAPGDRIRLTETTPAYGLGQRPGLRVPKADGAVLEGEVLGVKFKNGQYKVRIKGFETSGNAVWWPIRDYHVEVLHRAYRWTGDDRVIAELAGFGEKSWKEFPETRREAYRQQFGKRAERIKKMLGAE